MRPASPPVRRTPSRRTSVRRPRAYLGSAGAVLVAASLLLTGCQGDQGDAGVAKPATPSPEATTGQATGPCLLTADQLTEITGVAQELGEPRQVEDTVVCETALGERAAGYFWDIEARSSTPELEELRDEVQIPGGRVQRTSLDDGTEAWLVQGGARPQPAVEVLVGVDETVLRVYASTMPATDDPYPRDRLTEETVAIASALVSALSSSGN